MRKQTAYTLFLALILLQGSAWSDCTEHFFSDVDFPLVDQFVNSKRSLTFEDKKKNLKVFGDVRADWIWRKESEGMIELRGDGARDRFGIPIVPDQIEAKMNLMTDYSCRDFWGFMNIEFANFYGIERREGGCRDFPNSPQLLFGSGFCNLLCLKRAYMGMTVWKEEGKKLDLELGRKALYYNFDSRIQYKARVDGLFARYNNNLAKYAEGRSSDFFIKAMGFVIDYYTLYWGAVAETGIYNIFDTGFDWKYSFINWRNKKPNRCGVADPDGWRYTNSQITVDYNFRKPIFGKKLNLYGAYIINHSAARRTFIALSLMDGEELPPDIVLPDNAFVVNPDTENDAWYLGFIWGEVKKQGDLSFDFNYQYVEAQSIPDCDVRGIGRGNLFKETFTGNRRGNANYKGLHAELLYAITDGLSIDIRYEFSRSVDKRIGPGDHRFLKFEVELIQRF